MLDLVIANKILQEINVTLNDEVIDVLLRYTEMLYSSGINVISKANMTRESVFRAHIADSLAGKPLLSKYQVTELADLGCGAGLPGIPNKIVRNEMNLIAIDSSKKKILYVQQVVRELCLKGVSFDNRHLSEIINSGRKYSAISIRGVNLSIVAEDILKICKASCKIFLWTTLGPQIVLDLFNHHAKMIDTVAYQHKKNIHVLECFT